MTENNSLLHSNEQRSYPTHADRQGDPRQRPHTQGPKGVPKLVREWLARWNEKHPPKFGRGV